ncbi:MAG: DUF4105 domain-containing protein [Sphaerochaetaceae bacterium]
MFNTRVLRYGLVVALLVICSLGTLGAISALDDHSLYDPFSSQELLKDRTFLRELSPTEERAIQNLELSLVTAGRGDPLYVWFGHSGIVVSDYRIDRSVMYDYGIFSFDEGFYQTFAMGRLNYQVWATSAPARYASLIDHNRSITKIKLNLSDSAKLEVINFLNFNIKEENNTYLYHHYRENCATRIRDIIDKGVDGQLKAWAKSIPSTYTLRQLVDLHTYSAPVESWLLNFLQSGSIDKPITLWEAMFLPAVLESALMDFTYINDQGEEVKIASDYTVINPEVEGLRPQTLTEWRSRSFATLLVSLLFALLMRLLLYLASKSPLARITYGVINFLVYFGFGLLSLLLIFMVTISNHDVTYWNENLLFVTPWLLVMAFQALRYTFSKKYSLKRFRKGNLFFTFSLVAVIGAKLLFSGFFIQQNWQVIFTFLPLFVANSTLTCKRQS